MVRTLAVMGFAAALLGGCADGGGSEAESAGMEPAGEQARDAGRDGGRDAGRDAGRRDASTTKPRDAGATLPPDDGSSGDEDERCGVMRARVRDFKQEHDDFESVVNGRVVKGLVSSTLGPSGKPVLTDPSVAAREGIQHFEEWYADVTGVNEGFDVDIALEEQTDGKHVYDSDAFFPIDGRGFGNQYYSHNYHFTTEIRTQFVYKGGEQFTFAGDDDVWVFINGELAIDVGGVHGRETGTVDLDQKRDELGLTVGGQYTMDIFHAERHVTGSNFRIETTIECIEPVIVL